MTQHDPSDFFGHVQWWAKVEPAVTDHEPCPPFSVALIDTDGTLLLTLDMESETVALWNAVRTIRAARSGCCVQVADGTRHVIAWCNLTDDHLERWVGTDPVMYDVLPRTELSLLDKQMILLSFEGEVDDLIEA